MRSPPSQHDLRSPHQQLRVLRASWRVSIIERHQSGLGVGQHDSSYPGDTVQNSDAEAYSLTTEEDQRKKNRLKINRVGMRCA